MIAHLSAKERFGYACLIGILLFAFGFIGARHLRQPAPIVFESPKLATESGSAPQALGLSAIANSDVVVHVAGAVAKPGVVRLGSGARVIDAIKAAGGSLRNADLDSINLAAKVIDGTQLRVPTKDLGTVASSHKPTSTRPRATIDKSGTFSPVLIEPSYLASAVKSEPAVAKEDSHPTSRAKKVPTEVAINTASAEELQSLPGVGPTTAQKIIAFRERNGLFRSITDLLDVPGIGEKKLEKMRAYVRI